MRMLADPWSITSKVGYPDDTLLKTASTVLNYTNTLSIPASYDPAGAGTNCSFKTLLRTRPLGGVDTFPLDWRSRQGVRCAPAAQVSGEVVTQYGSAVFDYSNWLTFYDVGSVSRTLAAAIKVRVVGLPASTFMAPGRLYFLQASDFECMQDNNAPSGPSPSLNTQLFDLPATVAAASRPTILEANAIAAVRAGKGFSLTLQEILDSKSGATVPFLPVGPGSFVYTPNPGDVTVFASSYTPLADRYDLAQNQNLIVLGFGILQSTVLQFDYAAVVEYVPEASAAGIIATNITPPDSAERESILTRIANFGKELFGSISLEDYSRAYSRLDELSRMGGGPTLARRMMSYAMWGAGARGPPALRNG